MSTETAKPEPCQVDFYLLGDASLRAGNLACRLAMMAWERKQTIYIIAATDSLVRQLDEQMWEFPSERFLPHSIASDPNASKAPVTIGTLPDLKPVDVVINLCPEAVAQTDRYQRVLEIVPYADDERQASRVKYQFYRKLGLQPRTHEINK